MKRTVCAALLATIALLQLAPAYSATSTFTFEAAGVGPDLVWGSRGTVTFPVFSAQGFDIDVFPSGQPNAAMHWHETNSVLNDKVPDRPADKVGVLWRDSRSGQDPLVFVAGTPTFRFALQSLVIGASTADGSQTAALRLRAFVGSSLIGSTDLVTPADAYAAISGAPLGALDGLFMDRLEMVGLSSSSFAYYMLDDVAFNTAPIPEPATYALMAFGLGLVVLGARRRRG